MPGPVKHAMISKYNAEKEGLKDEAFMQRILGAIIPDTHAIEKKIHSSPLNTNGHADYEQFINGIKEHVERDDFHHSMLKIYFGHEISDMFDDAHLLWDDRGKRRVELYNIMIRSIDYGQRNIDGMAKVISDICDSDYEETREGIEKHLRLVRFYLNVLNKISKVSHSF